MKSRLSVMFIVLSTIIVTVGCSSSSTPTAQGIPKSAEMRPSDFNPAVMVYRNPDVDIRQYTRVMLTPVEIYKGEDASFKDATPQEQQDLANYLYSTVTKTLNEKGLLAAGPGPGVATLKLILAGVEKTRPVASTVTHVLPIGLALNLGKGALGKNGSFMGTATVGCELTDATTGTLIATFLAKEAPNAMDLPVVISTWDASKKAMDKVAAEIANRVEQAQSGKKQ